MAERFYVSFPLGLVEVLLQGPEAHHLAVVCRKRPGDAVCLFDGHGSEFEAIVTSVAKKSVALRIVGQSRPVRELGFELLIAAPLPKGDRAEYLIEKLTELGVTQFMPLKTDRSMVHPRETKLEKLERTVIEASKQCGRNTLMRIHPLTTWRAIIGWDHLPEERWMADPGGLGSIRLTGGHDIAFAVGPEGGWTDAELNYGMETDWKALGLGPRILRVETAAIALAASTALRGAIIP